MNLTVPELAERYRTSVHSVYHWLKEGKGPKSFRVGKRRLFALDDVLAWEKAAKEAG